MIAVENTEFQNVYTIGGTWKIEDRAPFVNEGLPNAVFFVGLHVYLKKK